MKSHWNDSELQALIAQYAQQGINQDLAIRTYTTRLLGSDPQLVLHGGGNTSVKTNQTDALGTSYEVLCVKGSGWDMGVIEPQGLPAVQLQPLANLAKIEKLSDEDLVATQRRLLLDPYAPNPSIEAVLHAIIPHKHVDHTHANAIVALTNQPDGENIIRDLFPDTTIIPYVMPGFALAQVVYQALQQENNTKHLLLMNHGIFTFHDDPRESYEQMIRMCDMAEQGLAQGASKSFVPACLPQQQPEIHKILPIIRGALAQHQDSQQNPKRWVLDFRKSEAILEFVNGENLKTYATRGNATPDHSIRIKRFGMVAPAPDLQNLPAFEQGLHQAVQNFASEYAAYFERNNARLGGGLRMLDAIPRIVYIPGLGLVGVGKTKKEAAICADIAETTVDVISKAEAMSEFQALSEQDLFDVEYWSLEQAKLASAKEKPLHRQIAVVTGAASGLGLETARLLKSKGAEVALLDINKEEVIKAAESLGALGVYCDVTDEASVQQAIRQVVSQYGGIDILISNAGAAFAGSLLEVEDVLFRKAFELNFWSHHLMARETVKIMQRQASGGAIVFNVTKQVLNPGPNFGPYGTSKSALMALVRQYAIEHGKDGITANAVNADRIRTNLLTEDFISERAKARGITNEEYMRGNLLGREVLASDVAESFVHLACARKTTGAILTVDGGNAAAMVR